MSKEDKIAIVMKIFELIGVIPEEEPQETQEADQSDFPTID